MASRRVVGWLVGVRVWWLVVLLGVVGCGQATLQSTVRLGEDVLYFDDFTTGRMGEWQFEGDSAGRTTVVNEQLVIELNAPHILQFATSSNQIFADFTLEVDTRQLGGDLSNSHGVLFRMQDPEQFYRFEITGNGLYMLERRNSGGTWTRFVEDWTPSPAINQGHNASNRLKVEAVGPVLSAYVNDVLVQQVSDDAYAAGAIALDAGTFSAPELQVAFDNLVVRRP